MIKPDARRILVVDDMPAIHNDFRKILQCGPEQHHSLNATRDLLFGEASSREPIAWRVDSAHQCDEGVEKVRQSLAEGKPYSVAFIDMRMPPGKNGLETTKQIWQLDPEVLVVLCTAYTDFTWNEIVDQLGSSDRFLILKKPFETIEVRQMALALSERWNVARTDPLTGALNRRSLLEYLRRWWPQSRTDDRLCCAMVDLDCFKAVNDSCGHQAGDAVLVETAKLLREHVRPQDVVARYGGEEFCVLMQDVDEPAAAAWADAFRQRLKGAAIELSDRTLHVTASIGVAQRTSDTATASMLMAAADQALYVAKRTGRDRVIAHSGITPQSPSAYRRKDRCDALGPSNHGMYQPELNLVELLCELQDECGRLLKVVDGEQSADSVPVKEHVHKMHDRLTQAMELQVLFGC
ncbi:MAG: diguanylate cyclase [Aureliella sp.]